MVVMLNWSDSRLESRDSLGLVTPSIRIPISMLALILELTASVISRMLVVPLLTEQLIVLLKVAMEAHETSPRVSLYWALGN